MDNGAACYRRYLSGDDSGLVEIIRDYKDGLVLYINSFTANIDTAEDLMEDTFVKLAAKKPHFWGKCTFKTWLYAIARNLTIDHLRRGAKHISVSLDECRSFPSGESGLEASYIREEQKLLLHRTLGRLKPEYRQVLHLIYFEEFSHTEAAVVMKKNRHQIDNLVYRARLSLKKELNKEGIGYEDL